MKPFIKAVLALSLLLLLSGNTFAADSLQDPAQRDSKSRHSQSSSEKWKFSTAFYFWLAGIEGDVTVDGVKSSVDASFSDIFENIDIGFMGWFEFSKGKWAIYVDPMYMKLSADTQVESIEAELEFKSAMVEFGTLYRVGEFPVGGGRKLSLEVLAGGRYTYQKSQIRISGTGPLALRFSDGMSEEWFDPIVGGRVILNLTEKLNLIAKGDIGGFGVGSDFTWNAFGGIGYRISLFGKEARIIAGYRALYQDYENGSGSNKYAYDATMQGPLFGLRIRF